MVEVADCIDWLNRQPAKSLDLVFGSPPYEDARAYDGLPSRRGQEWVAWMVEVTRAATRACRGLVAWVVEGRTKNFRWTATPALLLADLYRASFNLRKPAIFARHGIPGSGGPDWLRGDTEWIVCVTPPGRLPWSDPTACGHPPKFPPGGNPTNRVKKGSTNGYSGGDIRNDGVYKPPKLANPGNIIEEASEIVRCKVGGGHLGHPLAHNNEAPFPLALAEFFVRTFCPPGGTVADVFAGSGTTAHAALMHGRQFRGCDVRQSQVDLTLKRLEEVRWQLSLVSTPA